MKTPTPTRIQEAPTQQSQRTLSLRDNTRYQILGLVARGPGTRVYKARDRDREGRLVAVKRMDTTHTSFDRFAGEVEVLQLLNRRFPTLAIPRALDWFVSARARYLVMNFIAGQTLEETLRRRGGPLSVREALLVGQALCGTMKACHSCDPAIIHRDIKPLNVIGGADGEMVLSDFGTATLADARPEPGFRGTWGYAAPEQSGGQQITPAADIYALGATLYELLSGEYPGKSMAHLGNTQVIPDQVGRLLRQMLQPDVRKRITSVLDVEDILLALLQAQTAAGRSA